MEVMKGRRSCEVVGLLDTIICRISSVERGEKCIKERVIVKHKNWDRREGLTDC